MKDKPENSPKALEACEKLIKQLKEHLSILPSECEKIGAANEQVFYVPSQAIQLAVKNYLEALSIMQDATDEHQRVIVASQIQLQDPLLKDALLVRRKVEISANLVNMAQTLFQAMLHQTQDAVGKAARVMLEKLKIETMKAIEELVVTNTKIQKEASESLAKMQSISNAPNYLPHFNGLQPVSASAASPIISQAETDQANSAAAKMSGKPG